jgi:hypothetical protein
MINIRASERFVIPMAALWYNKMGFLFSNRGYDEEFYPVINISRGGLLFLTNNPLKIKTKVSLKIFYPDEEVLFTIKGRVRRVSTSPGISYKYMIAVQFDPFSKKKRQNDPSCLEKIKNLERLFLKKEEEAFGISS